MTTSRHSFLCEIDNTVTSLIIWKKSHQKTAWYLDVVLNETYISTNNTMLCDKILLIIKVERATSITLSFSPLITALTAALVRWLSQQQTSAPSGHSAFWISSLSLVGLSTPLWPGDERTNEEPHSESNLVLLTRSSCPILFLHNTPSPPVTPSQSVSHIYALMSGVVGIPVSMSVL